MLERVRALSDPLRVALSMLPEAKDDPAVVETVWQGEGLGTLLWSLGLSSSSRTTGPSTPSGCSRPRRPRGTCVRSPRSSTPSRPRRLWHWRTRTEALRAADALELPTSWDSLEQLVAVAAMRGYERGLLPSPLRGDFPAFGTGYRDLSPAQSAEVISIAYERHRALEWLVR